MDMLKMSQLLKRPESDGKIADASANCAAGRGLSEAELDQVAGSGTGYKPGTTGGALDPRFS